MFRTKHSILIFLILSTSTISTENIFGKTVKNWVTAKFGIDANEPLLNEAFNPTIKNLHTVTLTPTEQANSGLSVAQIAEHIDLENTENKLYLTLQTDADNALEKTWQVDFGINIKKNEATFVYSRGYAGADKPENPRRRNNRKEKKERKPRGMCAIPKRGGSVVVGTQWLKMRIVNGTCVMFDYPDTRSYFDFGLKNDQRCLDTIYNALQEKTENLIFFGNCRGSKSLLHFLSHSQPQNVRAVILDAPFLDLLQFTQEIGKNYGKRIPFSKDLAYKVITYWHPSYHKSDDLTLNDLKQIPKHIPIFIGHLYQDALVSDQLIKDVVCTLRDSGHIVYLLVIDDASKSHSRLYQTKPFAQAVNAFLKHLNLPHDPILANKGKFLFNNSAYNAKNINNWHKDGFPYIYKNK